MKQIKAAVIGCGYWGPNVIRNFVELPQISLEAVVDLDTERLRHVQDRYPNIPLVTNDIAKIFDSGLDAVAICTPAETHHPLARACLDQGLDVLVEKPLTTSPAEAADLVAFSEERQRVLMVGHTFEYNPAVHALKAAVQGGDLGTIHYVDAVRVGLGLFRPNSNVLWDLAPHDVSILLHVLEEMPYQVSTRGAAYVHSTIEDVAYMTLNFPSGVLAHVRMSWLDPLKTRRLTVVGSRKMAVYDDVEAHEKIKVFDKCVSTIRRTDSLGEFQFAYHYGNVVSPYVELEEPLRVQSAHFAECVLTRQRPLTDGRNGLRIVQIIAAAQRSLADGGVPVPIGLPTQTEAAGAGVAEARLSA